MIIVSAGFNKSHLLRLSAELEQAGCLSQLYMGTSPYDVRILGLYKILSSSRYNRIATRINGVSPVSVFSFPKTELIQQAGILMRGGIGVGFWNDTLKFLGEKACVLSRNIYSGGVSKSIDGGKGDIYLFRAGYGGKSIPEAKLKGMIVVCDHSIVHPDLVAHLIDNKGAIPNKPVEPCVDKFWSEMRDDIKNSDYILVNSKFVKDTCVFQGVPADKIKVKYLGVDSSFLKCLASSEKYDVVAPKLLFAGFFGKRKGAVELINAFNRMDNDVTIMLAGSVDPALKLEYPDFFSNPRVQHLGYMNRQEMANIMSSGAIFVFPSLAEGSAQVIFEALAAGMYVITTPNSGSIVEDGVHGKIIEPGSEDSLVDAVRWCKNNIDIVNRIGECNKLLIESSFTQGIYGAEVAELLLELADNGL